MTEERKKKLHASVTRPVIIYLSNGSKVHAYIIDLAGNGFSIKTAMPAGIGVQLIFKFSLPLKSQIHDFVIKGKVVYCHLRADKYVSGIQFINMKKEYESLFKAIILELNGKRK